MAKFIPQNYVRFVGSMAQKCARWITQSSLWVLSVMNAALRVLRKKPEVCENEANHGDCIRGRAVRAVAMPVKQAIHGIRQLANVPVVMKSAQISIAMQIFCRAKPVKYVDTRA